MSPETLSSRLCSHRQATCSLRPPAQLLPTVVRARGLPKRYSSEQTARYSNTPSNRCCTASSNANTGFRRSDHYKCASASAETDATVSGLQADLEAAVSAEDYPRAANLRDELTKLQQDSSAAVTEANRKFYAAFEHCSIQAMSEIWGHGDHVQCMHPAAECIQGREDVLESWRMVLRGEFQIKLENLRVHATQDTGYVTCVEVMNAGNAKGRTIATNIFQKQKGEWKMVLHQGGPTPSFAS